MRHWLFTSTTYGTWLPGDERGFVGRVWEQREEDPLTTALRRSHDQPNTPYDEGMLGLANAAADRMNGEPIYFRSEQAELVLQQFLQTAAYRGWQLHAASVMSNHFHLVVSADAEIPACDMLRDFKSYASRVLNRQYGKPQSGTWWTASGSRRPLTMGADGLASPIRYTLDQYQYLRRWLHPDYGSIDAHLSGGRKPAVPPTGQANKDSSTPPERRA